MSYWPLRNSAEASTFCRNARFVARGPLGPTSSIRQAASAASQALQRLFASRAVRGDFGQHRVVVGRDLLTGDHARVDAHTGQIARQLEALQESRLRQEALLRIFGVQANFDRVAFELGRQRCGWQRLTRRDAQLQLDQIEPGDQLGDRMLDLQARVHLQKVQLAGRVGHELDRARAAIVGRAHHGKGRLKEL